MRKEILRMENIITNDHDRTNLENFNLHVFQGEIMGLIGVNAHGKEILIDLICRNTPIKFGRIYLGGRLVNHYLHSDNSYNKVYVIDQKSKLVNDLTVVDNIFVLRKGFKKYFINPKVLCTQLEAVEAELGVDIAPNSICFNLTLYERCVVEILKAVIQGMKLIVVNDLSNLLGANDLLKLKEIFAIVSKKQYSVIYISNHHEEVFSFCDRVAFIKDGKCIKVFDQVEMLEKNVLPFIISFGDNHPSEKTYKEETAILFEHIITDYMKDISFRVNRGSCVVIYDKSNEIQTEMIQIFCDNTQTMEGTITLGTSVILKENVSKLLGNQVAIIGENAIYSSIFYSMSYIDNLCFLLDKKTNKSNITAKIKKSIQKEYYKELGEELYETDITKLSKKSLYNLVYYRIHLMNPKVVFIAQPFSNADMYLRRHIIHLIRNLKRKGIAVIILAVSISDSLFVADELFLVEKGKLKGQYLPDAFSQIDVK